MVNCRELLGSSEITAYLSGLRQPGPLERLETEDYGMYVYLRSEPQLWTVGFYAPDGEWIPESDHECRDDAAERVHWLNGGGKPSDTIKDFILDLSRMSGTGNGIGASTIAKLKAFAKEYGYL